MAPAHPQFAEFLAARHLASQIAGKHLSVGRVLALMLGFDGELLPSFRNLAAWLAALGVSQRPVNDVFDVAGNVLALRTSAPSSLKMRV